MGANPDLDISSEETLEQLVDALRGARRRPSRSLTSGGGKAPT
jgi:hypothetical protein